MSPRLAATAALGLMTVGFVCSAAGLQVNTTRSIPVGLYQLSDATASLISVESEGIALELRFRDIGANGGGNFSTPVG